MVLKPIHASLWVAKRERKDLLEFCKLHMGKVLEVVREMRGVVYAFCDGNAGETKARFNAVFKREREADAIKKDILTKLSTGPFHPMDRESILGLVLVSDKIADNAKACSRKLCMVSPKGVPADISAGLKGLADSSCNIAQQLEEALSKLGEDAGLAIQATHEVEASEEGIDESRVDLELKLLEWGDKIKKVSSWLMIKEAIGNMEEVADKAEDTAGIIRTLALLMG